ncbi:MAG: hypothetical protein Q9206_002352 [Seirophora lacunosa]
MSHSRDVEQFWLRMDLLGILIVTEGTHISGINYIFPCEPKLQKTHWTTIIVSGLVTAIMVFVPRFQRWRTVRTCAYIAVGATSFIPLIHGCKRYGLDYMLQYSGLKYYLIELSFYGGSAVLYASDPAMAAVFERARSLIGYAGSFARPRLLTASKSAVLAFLKNTQIGSLTITDEEGETTVCDKSTTSEEDGERSVYDIANAELIVRDSKFWIRAGLFAGMGLAESYMLGEIECSDLTAFFKVFLTNKKYFAYSATWTSNVSARIGGIVRKTNSLTNARLHIAAHYNISNDMFAGFLSQDKTYSCALWLPKTDNYYTVESLEQAQYRKLQRVIDNARIRSQEQKALAQKRIKAARYEDKIKVLLIDYRSLPVPMEEDENYDKIVSIEMLEAVGAEYLDTYFRCVDNLLKTEGGVAVFQCITIPESRYKSYRKSDDFIRRYIFPGGHLPTKTLLLESIRSGSSHGHSPRLIPESVENIGLHYAKTLRCWRENFMKNFESVIKPALLAEHKENGSMSNEYVEVFKRKCEYYFSYCEAGFATKTLGDAIITVGREGAVQMMEDVPL